MSELGLNLIQLPTAQAYLTPIDPRIAASTGATVANTVYWMRLPRTPAAQVITKGYYFWASGAANGAIALLTADRAVITEADATAATYTAVASTASTAAAGASTWQALSFTASYTYQPGVDLWVAVGFDAAATILRHSSLGSISLPYGMAVSKATAYSAGITSPLSGSLASTALYPAVIVG